jgi:hypothetical protein
MYHAKEKKCGRKKVGIDMSTIPIIPLNKRTTIRALAHELDVKKPILHCCFKLGMICRHSNNLKPYLRDDNKKERLRHCVCMIDGDILHFIPMKNIIHSDEKWFNTTKKAKKFYMLPEEEDLLRTIHNKNSIPKFMLLCCVTEPRYDGDGKCYFDGKIGIWPFVGQEPAKRDSKDRKKGTPITKPITVIRDVSRSCLITKVLPAIVVKWPREARGETISIQQDNTRTHIEPNDEAFFHAVCQTKLGIRIFNQPANSPDLNVLDLGFFVALQSETYITSSKNMDELIRNVQTEFTNYDQSKIRNVFLTQQGCMTKLMKMEEEMVIISPI